MRKKENSNHRACTSEGCFFFLHRAQPVSEMEQSGIELHGAAREGDEAERNRAAWLEPDGLEAQPVSELEQSGIELHGVNPLCIW